MFAPVLQLVLDDNDYSNCIKNGVRTCGLYSFELEAIKYNVLIKETKKSNKLQHIDESQDLQTDENQKLLDCLRQMCSLLMF